MNAASPPPPLPPPLPPTPHPDDAPLVAAPPTAESPTEPELTLLLRAGRLPEAAAFLRAADSEQLRAEVALACAALPLAPSLLLRCIDLLAASSASSTRLPLLLEPVTQCVTPALQAQLSPADQALAADLLPRVVAACRALQAAAFARAFRVDGERVVAFVRAELLPRDAFAAVQLLDALRLKRAVPAADVVQHALLQREVRAADLFIKGASREDRVMYVQRLVSCNTSDKIVKKRIAQLKLDPSEFPEYLKRKQYGALRFMLHSGQFDDALTFVEHEDALKKYACQTLVRRRGPADAATRQFVFRAGLAELFPQVDVSGQAALAFQLDGVADGDDANADAAAATYLSLDAMIGDANLHFVDSPEQLRECVAHLREHSVVGFDSEWKTVHADATTGRTHSFCAVLQLATREKAFVVDLLSLGPHGAMLRPVLASDDVLVLGFDTRGDLGAVRSLLFPEGGGEAVAIARLLDVQAVARKLLALGLPARAGAGVSGGAGDAASADAGNAEAAREALVSAETATADSSNSGDAPVAAPATGEQQALAGFSEGGKPAAQRGKKKKRGAATSATSVALTSVADLYLGKPLDKRLRMSDWTKRPLTPAQMRYAALDALVLVHILDKMRETLPPDALEAVVRRCTQKNVR